MRKHFWNWVQNSDENVLRLNGVISETSWDDDNVTPELFRSELEQHSGDITVWINSPGGDVFAAAQIYTMLMEHKGNVTIKIDGLAASAASVVAMAGSTVEMSPVSHIMIHNPWTMAVGDEHEMQSTAEMLKEVKESIINAYELKTGLSRQEISDLMDSDSFMNAKKAVRLGFADKILYTDNEQDDGVEDVIYSRAKVMDDLRARLCNKKSELIKPQQLDTRVSAEIMMKRLSLLAR